MDLTNDFPRSPRETLMGIPMLPRTIDKARALLSATLGEYVFGEKSSFDMSVLGFLGLSPGQFLEGVRESADDATMTRTVPAFASVVRSCRRTSKTGSSDGPISSTSPKGASRDR